MPKPVLTKSKAIIIFLVFALGYFISTLLRAINATISPELVSEFIDLADKEGNNTVKAKVQKVEDFGNFKLLTATMKNFTIKSKIEREKPISNDEVNLYIPAEKCCVYEDEKLL